MQTEEKMWNILTVEVHQGNVPVSRCQTGDWNTGPGDVLVHDGIVFDGYEHQVQVRFRQLENGRLLPDGMESVVWDLLRLKLELVFADDVNFDVGTRDAFDGPRDAGQVLAADQLQRQREANVATPFTEQTRRFQDESAAAILQKFAHVQHHVLVERLVIERHQLTAGVPELGGFHVTGILPRRLGINAAQLPLSEPDAIRAPARHEFQRTSLR